MNQIKIGNYIAKKRKTLNLTQEQLAEEIGISSTIIESLCNILKITTSELFNGEDDKKINDKQMIEKLKRIQNLENQKNIIFGTLLMILGIASACMSSLFGGSTTKDFISGFLMGLSIVEMLVGIYATSSALFKR